MPLIISMILNNNLGRP